MQNFSDFYNDVQTINEILRPSEYKDKRFTVGGTISDRILLFDMDETILSSVAKIYVKDKEGNLIRELTPEQFNHDKLKTDEEYDFSDFRSYETLLKSVMLPYWETLKREYTKGTHIGILTARGGIKQIRKFFLAKGIDIKPDLIFATGDDVLELTAKEIDKKKAECIERLYKVGYRTFIFFDDNDDNLQSVKKIEKKLPIKVHLVKADFSKPTNEDEYWASQEVVLNEGLSIGSFDVSAAIVITSILSSLATMGFAITGRIINNLIANARHAKMRGGKNDLLGQLKELTRSVPDITDKYALSVLNNPGEWDSAMIEELRRALYDKMTDEQRNKFNALEKEYIGARNKFYALK